ncbi:TonB-dependent receptor [Cytophagaceae bacterium DM2B3-1]|uniref:TonB-dependent receptor n=1 Tax=Xanthocytophaga flava TaxID=3048013 RepID=A0ABT7CIG8_9BACT|nr:TonB-dependent receptor [Xanthocytophaga flavus]MDJ1469587.1 TonB-dependent receptor [Xanthocytophaga flavus]MDJ1493532.1 TonB-dependent receptor [Xanthocytophaga flavus]
MGQQLSQVRFSGNFKDVPLSEVLQSLEQQALQQQQRIHFFYETPVVSTIKVYATFTNVPLAQVMPSILASTQLSYLLYDSNYILLINKEDLSSLSLSPHTVDSAGRKPHPENIPSTEATNDSQETIREKMNLITTKRGTNTYSITGLLTDATNNKKLEGATVYVEEMRSGVLSDANGNYQLALPAGTYNLVYSYVGFQSKRRQISVRSNQTINISLLNTDIRLREVVVTAEAADRNISTTQMGITKLNIRTIKKMPPLLGEVDIVRSVLLLPGVSTVGEGSTGFNVRGGSIDQNLILMDNAPIYNTSHMFGLFSVFNPDIVRDVTLYRGGISARFGGRVSSVLDIQLKDANAQKVTINGGIGLVASRLAIEAPIIKDKLSFIVAGRGSFTDFLLKNLPNESLRKTRANFYDVNAKADYRINSKNTLSLSGYISDDFLQINADSILTIAVNSSITQYRWSNKYGVLKWQHFFSEKLTNTTSLTYSNYTAKVINPTAPNEFKIPSQLKQFDANSDFSYQLNDNHKLSFGIQGIRYFVQPENLEVTPPSDINPISISTEHGVETAIYLEDDFTINKMLTLTYGLRYSHYLNIGPATVNMYAPDSPRESLSVIDSTSYGAGSVIKTYGGLEPRLSLKISLNESSSIKIGYNRMRQYIHLISNTASAIPTARWQLSNTYLKPQIGDQIAVGYFRNLFGNMFETSIEVYYKKIYNFLDYKDNAVVFLNRNIETAVLQGQGRSYGVELLLRKNIGEYLTGWMSYTYARTFAQMKSQIDREQVNEGDWYPANYDKPHTFNLVLNYQLKKRIGFSMNYTYSTGRPVTYPESKFAYGGIIIPDYGLRNQRRIPDYHRLDVAVNIDSGYRKKKKVDKSWTFAVYNLYSRNNAYSVFFKQEGGSANAYKLSIFGAAFPSLTYNFKF